MRLALSLLFGVSASALTKTTIMSGLASPRGLAFAPDGSLYVAESGSGGSTCVSIETKETCFGLTGGISRLRKGKQEKYVQGLPSISAGGNYFGPSDVSFQGGALFATLGLGKNFPGRALLPPAAQTLATLIQVTGPNAWRKVADVGEFEGTFNPEGPTSPLETNPNSVFADGPIRWVIDAAGNSLLKVTADGKISNETIFKSAHSGGTVDAVPTNVVKGPDGALYISQLTGAPFAANAANVFRVVPGQHTYTVFRTGFTNLIDLAFDSQRNMYALSIAGAGLGGSGSITKVAPNGDRTVLVSDLSFPTGIQVDSKGAIYVSNHGVSATSGEVLKYVV